ncbi:MAG: hypothetical protein EP330_10530 [Deltaproteobacteria bacterium]|nr:MAG: hypothetical protein EP330_10530 [Deltaproteobacteria bacterium]
MRRISLVTAAAVVTSFLLACGGGGLGSSASQRAQDLCTHLNGEHEGKWNPGVSCQAVGVGTKPVAQGIQVEVISVKKIVGKDSLPEIQNSTERAKFSKVKNNALAIEIEYTNTTPVKSGVEARVGLHTAGGDLVFTSPYNSKTLIAEAGDGYVHLWDDPKLGPSQSKRSIHVIALPAGDEEGSVLQVFGMEERVDEKDPRGRKKDFYTDFYILDLPPIEGL